MVPSKWLWPPTFGSDKKGQHPAPWLRPECQARSHLEGSLARCDWRTACRNLRAREGAALASQCTHVMPTPTCTQETPLPAQTSGATGPAPLRTASPQDGLPSGQPPQDSIWEPPSGPNSAPSFQGATLHLSPELSPWGSLPPLLPSDLLDLPQSSGRCSEKKRRSEVASGPHRGCGLCGDICTAAPTLRGARPPGAQRHFQPHPVQRCHHSQ